MQDRTGSLQEDFQQISENFLLARVNMQLSSGGGGGAQSGGDNSALVLIYK